jgi:uncharacterized protein YkwD
MRALACITVVIVLSACTGFADPDPDPPPGGGGSEPAELAGILAAHNATRASVGVAPMRWNDSLESLAGGFIADCQFAHSTSQQRSNTAGFQYIGENLYQSGGFQPTGMQINEAWASEESDYDYGSNSCSGVCGHYTQIVWEDSTDLGCAMKQCGNGYLVSCEYGPGGNIIGQRPY